MNNDGWKVKGKEYLLCVGVAPCSVPGCGGTVDEFSIADWDISPDWGIIDMVYISILRCRTCKHETRESIEM